MASGVGREDSVIEVGPGLGSLTLPLLDAAGRVVAVEIDPVLAERLPRTVAERAPQRAGALTVVGADALAVTVAVLSPSRSVTASALHQYSPGSLPCSARSSALPSSSTP